MTGNAETFLSLPEQDRRDVFEATASRLDTLPGYVEKDFWVCLVLDALYNRLPAGHPNLLFKGGTSLSKAFGLIKRFSEDIDLVVFRDALGFEGERDPTVARNLSNRRRAALFEELRVACSGYIRGDLQVALTRPIDDLVDGCHVVPDEDEVDGQTLFVEYPTLYPSGDIACVPAHRGDARVRGDHGRRLGHPHSDLARQARDRTASAAAGRGRDEVGGRNGYRPDNPAGDAVGQALGRQQDVVQHTRAFEFLVLTAARSGEVRLATWDEMDLDAGVWTIPAARMKTKRDHRVPLSGRALAILHDVPRLSDGTGPGVSQSAREATLRHDATEIDQGTRHRRRAAWVPVELPGLGRGSDKHTPRGSRSGARPYGAQPDGGSLRPQ